MSPNVADAFVLQSRTLEPKNRTLDKFGALKPDFETAKQDFDRISRYMHEIIQKSIKRPHLWRNPRVRPFSFVYKDFVYSTKCVLLYARDYYGTVNTDTMKKGNLIIVRLISIKVIYNNRLLWYNL